LLLARRHERERLLVVPRQQEVGVVDDLLRARGPGPRLPCDAEGRAAQERAGVTLLPRLDLEIVAARGLLRDVGRERGLDRARGRPVPLDGRDDAPPGVQDPRHPAPGAGARAAGARDEARREAVGVEAVEAL